MQITETYQSARRVSTYEKSTFLAQIPEQSKINGQSSLSGTQIYNPYEDNSLFASIYYCFPVDDRETESFLKMICVVTLIGVPAIFSVGMFYV